MLLILFVIILWARKNVHVPRVLFIGMFLICFTVGDLVLTFHKTDLVLVETGDFNTIYKGLVLQFIFFTLALCKLSRIIVKSETKDIGVFMYKFCFKLILRLVDFSLFIPYTFWVFASIRDIFEVKLCIMSPPERDKLKEEMQSILCQLNKINSSLENIKKDNKGVVLVVTKSQSLELDVPNNSKLSDNDLSNLAQKAGIADRAYNTQLEQYQILANKDVSENQGYISNSLKEEADSIQDRHNKLLSFEGRKKKGSLT